MICKVAILGDFNPANPLHHAVNNSVRHVRKFLDIEFQCDWIQTNVFDSAIAFNKLYSGLWIVPGSPYKSMKGVIDAIEYARIHDIPTLGTCAGFQHMLIELARNLCGIDNADHEETGPQYSDLVISKLSCSLVGQEEELTVIAPRSKLSSLLQKTRFKGKYHCNYGLNDDYVEVLKKNGCTMTVVSPDGDVRAFELTSHPFFLGTLFQTPLASSCGEPNPIIMGFLKQSMAYSKKDEIPPNR